MKIQKDEKRLRTLIRTYKIDTLFSADDLPFELAVFEKGEFLNNVIDPQDYLCFPVSGTYRILHVRDDDSVSIVYAGSEFTCFGDMEFACNDRSLFLIEIVRRTTCIILPLANIRDQLKNDPVFLYYLLSSAADKLERITWSTAIPKDMRQRVLHYIRTECPNGILQGVGIACIRLNCSRRQLQRILKSMCDDGILAHTAKGTYTLTK